MHRKYAVYGLLFLCVIYDVFELWRHKPQWDALGRIVFAHPTVRAFQHKDAVITVTEFPS